MAAYTILNGTDTALASGGVTTAAYTIETGVTLLDADLAIVAALNGVAVMQDAATAAEKLAVGNLIVAYNAGFAPVDMTAVASYRVANGTDAMQGDSAADAYKLGDAEDLTPAQLVVVLETAGLAVVAGASTDADKATASKVLECGKIPGHSIS